MNALANIFKVVKYNIGMSVDSAILWGLKVENCATCIELAEWIGVSKRTIQRKLKKLVQKNIVDYKYLGGIPSYFLKNDVS